MKKTERKLTTPVPTDINNAIADASDNLSLGEIKELIELIAEKQFSEFELERGDFRLRLQKGAVVRSAGNPPAASTAQASNTADSALPNSINSAELSAPSAQTEAPQAVEEDLHIVTSPIVGTFYRASSPTSEPFAKLGDLVEAGKTICIVEAMKLMNEVVADASGSVAKIFVENGQPVEYGQPLFGIKQ